MNDGCPNGPITAVEMPALLDNLPDDKSDFIGRQAASASANHGIPPSSSSSGKLTSLTIGLIDPYRLTQDCLAKAFSDLHPETAMRTFATVKECLAALPTDLDLIVYYLHGNEIFEVATIQRIAIICQVFPSVPVIILSDADCAQLSRVTRAVLKSGARGFVPTRTSGFPVTLAAARLIREGGSFVPSHLLPTVQSSGRPTQQKRLTSREDEVLGQLQRGKANKIIAYELGMSESTVKVHIRNIMRKMGATNRTQVAYISQEHLREIENSEAMNAELLKEIAPFSGNSPHRYPLGGSHLLAPA
jgi:DNA-binding NarL/FixJ family response regulator